MTRGELVARARQKTAAPYSLDEELTFFCPVENLEGLELPVVRDFHAWLKARRPRTGEPAVLLLLPCQRDKPYPVSAEHRAVNRSLLDAGFVPERRGDWPEELAALAATELLANSPLRGHGIRIDRAVISEPFGLVPYEAVYRWRGALSPAARYDDPGLFEHRRIACEWRADCESNGRWGPLERGAFCTVHERLTRLIAEVLAAWRSAYSSVVAYVGAGLTHRSFLADAAERRLAGLPAARRGPGGRLLAVRGVRDLDPGLVDLVPDGAGLERLRRRHGGRLPIDLLRRPECLEMLLERLERA